MLAALAGVAEIGAMFGLRPATARLAGGGGSWVFLATVAAGFLIACWEWPRPG